MPATTPSYEELLLALQQLEQRFQAVDKAHTELLEELQARLIKIQASLDAGIALSRDGH